MLPAGHPSISVADPAGNAGWLLHLRLCTHDLLNSAGAIRELVPLLDQDDDRQIRMTLQWAIRILVDDLAALHHTVQVRSGAITAKRRSLTAAEAMGSASAFCAGLAIAAGRRLSVSGTPDGELTTDAALLHRVLVNLIKNAIEATPPSGTIQLDGDGDDDEVRFTVRNPGVIPQQVLASGSGASTKGEGRGLGLLSARLLVHEVLGGKLGISSDDRSGTAISVVLPRSPGD